MSATLQPPQGGPLPGPPPQGPQAPPGLMLNPAFAEWQKQFQAAQAIQAQNAQKQAQFMAAVDLLKRDGLRGFKLDIETDSTIAPDETQEKQDRVEFMQQFIPLMTGIVPMARGNPAIAELAKQAVLFAVRGFRVARQLEEQIEQAFDAIAKMPPDPKMAGDNKKPGADPMIEMAKVQADLKETEMRERSDMAMVMQKAAEAAQQAQVAMAKVNAENTKTAVTAITKQQEMAHSAATEQFRAMRPPSAAR